MPQPIPTDHILFIIIGPSGVGKNSITKRVLAEDSKLSFLTTCVTREPRPNEVDGKDYFFLTKEAFRQGIDMGLFLEYDEHYENYYGTRRQEVAKVFKSGQDAMTDFNWPGVAQVKAQMPDNLVSILILPPSISTLEERLVSRSAAGGKPVSSERFTKIREDILHMDNEGYVFTNPDMIGSTLQSYNHIVINDDLDQAVQEVHQIIARERQEKGIC